MTRDISLAELIFQLVNFQRQQLAHASGDAQLALHPVRNRLVFVAIVDEDPKEFIQSVIFSACYEIQLIIYL